MSHPSEREGGSRGFPPTLVFLKPNEIDCLKVELLDAAQPGG